MLYLSVVVAPSSWWVGLHFFNQAFLFVCSKLLYTGGSLLFLLSLRRYLCCDHWSRRLFVLTDCTRYFTVHSRSISINNCLCHLCAWIQTLSITLTVLSGRLDLLSKVSVLLMFPVQQPHKAETPFSSQLKSQNRRGQCCTSWGRTSSLMDPLYCHWDPKN